MVKRQDETQNGVRESTEKTQNIQPKVEYKRPEQQIRNRVNSQGYHQNQRVQNQLHQKNSVPVTGEQVSSSKEGQGTNQSRLVQVVQNPIQGHNQPQFRNNTQGPRNLTNHHEGSPREANPREANPREAGQNKGFYRDRSKDSERDTQPRQYSSPPGGRYGNSLRNKPEETIEDIKEDIVRLEKEIELEIKDIKSLKL